MKSFLKNYPAKKLNNISAIFKSLLFFTLFLMCGNAVALEFQMTPSQYVGGYNISCHGASNGSINIYVTDGVAPYTFMWNDGITTRNRTNLSAGNYSVTIMDANGETAHGDLDLIEPEVFQSVLIPNEYEAGYNISVFGGSDGAISPEIQGGVPPYTFLWSNGSNSESIDNLEVGTYTLTLHDATNCITNSNITLIEPTELHIVSISSPYLGSSNYNTSCGQAKATINLQIAGGTPPIYFDWDFGSFEQSPTDVPEGDHSVRIYDENGAEAWGNIVISSSPAITATATPFVYSNGKNTSCSSCNNASISLTNLVGVPPFNFAWNSGQTSQNITTVAAGSYSVMITDAVGCSAVRDINLVAPEREDWTMGGNNLSDNTKFIGTTNAQDLIFKANSSETMRLLSSGGTQFTGDVKISNTSGKSGMLFMDSNGKLINSEVDPQAPSCGHGSYPIWNTNQQDNIVFTCIPTKVGIGTTSFPNGSAFHLIGNSLFDGNIEIGNSVDNFDLKVNGNAQITSLAGGGTASLVQTDNDGLLSKVAFPTQTEMNYWNLSATTEINYFGKVGINTSSFPGGEDFHVSGKSLFNGDVVFNNDLKLNSFSNTGNELVMVDGAKKLFNAPASSIMSEVNFWKTNNNGTDLFHAAGKVGIGTNDPHSQLQVGNSVSSISLGSFWGGANSWVTNYIGFNAGRDETVTGIQKWTLNGGNGNANGASLITGSLGGDMRFISIESTGNVSATLTDGQILNAANEKMVIRSDGRVGIGTQLFDVPKTSTDVYKLYVTGGIRTEKVTVDVALDNDWADYVFDKKYNLMKIDEVEKYISEHKHLPGIPSSIEVKKEGVNVSEMFAMQMQKIEELTLYMIELKKENNALKEKVEKLETSK